MASMEDELIGVVQGVTEADIEAALVNPSMPVNFGVSLIPKREGYVPLIVVGSEPVGILTPRPTPDEAVEAATSMLAITFRNAFIEAMADDVDEHGCDCGRDHENEPEPISFTPPGGWERLADAVASAGAEAGQPPKAEEEPPIFNGEADAQEWLERKYPNQVFVAAFASDIETGQIVRLPQGPLHSVIGTVTRVERGRDKEDIEASHYPSQSDEMVALIYRCIEVSCHGHHWVAPLRAGVWIAHNADLGSIE